MTLRELKTALDKLDLDKDGDKPVAVWLPGTRINVVGVINIVDTILLEGSVEYTAGLPPLLK